MEISKLTEMISFNNYSWVLFLDKESTFNFLKAFNNTSFFFIYRNLEETCFSVFSFGPYLTEKIHFPIILASDALTTFPPWHPQSRFFFPQ